MVITGSRIEDEKWPGRHSRQGTVAAVVVVVVVVVVGGSLAFSRFQDFKISRFQDGGGGCLLAVASDDLAGVLGLFGGDLDNLQREREREREVHLWS